MDGGSEPAVSVTAEPRAEVDGWLRRPALRPRVRERLELVKAAARGYEVEAIAAWSGRSARTVRQ